MRALRIHDADNVAVALEDLRAGSRVVAGAPVELVDDIPRGHKFALRDIAPGEAVVKYGFPIGRAKDAILPGMHVHTHNLRTGLSEGATYAYAPRLTPPAPLPAETFQGYRRANGNVGIRNEIWIVPTVGCVNAIGQIIERRAAARVRGSVEGVYAFAHPYGCSQLGDDHAMTQRALCGLIHHPNAAAVLVLGLGCENNTIASLQGMLGHGDTERIRFLTCQEHEDEVEAALAIVDELIDVAARDERQPVPLSELVVGLKCGGSDGLSGITANPLVGAFSDRLVARGGSAILTEVPEMFGAETLLMARCESEAVYDKLVALIEGFKGYFTSHGQPVYENPSPGNKAGGISTLEDKSLGCTQKAGTANVVDVLAYGEPLHRRGLNLLEAPGNDLVAATALAVSGAHLVLFTTGRGTPFGAPVPTVKIASNSELARRKGNWIDFDAGRLLDTGDMGALAEELLAYVRALASGTERTRAERAGIRDLAIFKGGVTL